MFDWISAATAQKNETPKAIRNRNRNLNSWKMSLNSICGTLIGNFALELAAGKVRTKKLSSVPTTAIPSSTAAAKPRLDCPRSVQSASIPPSIIPMIVAVSVATLKIALPEVIFFSESNSGSEPTLAGAKRALWAPIKNTANINKYSVGSMPCDGLGFPKKAMASTPKLMITISAILQPMIT